MERVTKNQAAFLAFLVIATAVVVAGLLEPVLAASASKAIATTLLVLGLFWIIEHARATNWPGISLRRKAMFVGVMALGPFALQLGRNLF